MNYLAILKWMEKAERSHIIRNVLEFQHAILSAVFTADTAAYWAKLDLTMGQLRGLVALACQGAMAIGLLGATLGLSKPAATLLVNALVRQKLVERDEDPADRRRTLVKINAAGQELLEDLLRGKQNLFAGWMSLLGDADLEALAQGMGAMVRAATSLQNQQSRPAG